MALTGIIRAALTAGHILTTIAVKKTINAGLVIERNVIFEVSFVNTYPPYSIGVG